MTRRDPWESRLAALLLVACVPWRFSEAREPSAPPCCWSAFPTGFRPGSQRALFLRGRGFGERPRVHLSGTGWRVGPVSVEPEGLRVPLIWEADALPGIRRLLVLGPTGWSNPLWIRVDPLNPLEEIEPNDSPSSATPVPPESATSGVLHETDIDRFLLKSAPGLPLTIEVEARRLGTPISPVLALTDSDGRSLRTSPPEQGLSGDPRWRISVPDDGLCLIEVRDQLYRGGRDAAYRLRITAEPFGTGLFPLGGPRGKPLNAWLSGGTLTTPRAIALTLPVSAGETRSLDSIASVWSPFRLIAGDFPEALEGDPIAEEGLGPPITWNGRLDHPGQTDRLRFRIPADSHIRLQVEAATLGSRLDAVLRVSDEEGELVAENDDAPSLLAYPDLLGRPTRDSRIDLPSGKDRTLTVAIADRFGRGGPEFAFRLRVGPPRDDFALVVHPPSAREESEGWGGALNLLAGTTTRIPFRVIAEGRVGTLTVRVEGLPAGVSVAPVVVSLPPPGRDRSSPFREVSGILTLRVDESAPAFASEEGVRIVGRARVSGSEWRERFAEAMVFGPRRGIAEPFRPVVCRESRFPIAVISPLDVRERGAELPPGRDLCASESDHDRGEGRSDRTDFSGQGARSPAILARTAKADPGACRNLRCESPEYGGTPGRQWSSGGTRVVGVSDVLGSTWETGPGKATRWGFLPALSRKVQRDELATLQPGPGLVGHGPPRHGPFGFLGDPGGLRRFHPPSGRDPDRDRLDSRGQEVGRPLRQGRRGGSRAGASHLEERVRATPPGGLAPRAGRLQRRWSARWWRWWFPEHGAWFGFEPPW